MWYLNYLCAKATSPNNCKTQLKNENMHHKSVSCETYAHVVLECVLYTEMALIYEALKIHIVVSVLWHSVDWYVALYVPKEHTVSLSMVLLWKCKQCTALQKFCNQLTRLTTNHSWICPHRNFISDPGSDLWSTTNLLGFDLYEQMLSKIFFFYFPFKVTFLDRKIVTPTVCTTWVNKGLQKNCM